MYPPFSPGFKPHSPNQAPLCATVGLAAIESANIVGYQNIDFDKSGWMMNVGVAFANVGGSTDFTIAENIFGNVAVEGDQVVILDADAWNLTIIEKLGSGDGWVSMPADGSDPEIIASYTVAKGDMLYYIPVESDPLTVAGEVAALGEQTITFDLANEEGQWMFPLVNPFPIATTWGDLNAFTKEGDQLITLDADAWNLTISERLGDGDGWVVMPADGSDPEIINEPTDIVLSAGEAAYYIPVETVTWTVTL